MFTGLYSAAAGTIIFTFLSNHIASTIWVVPLRLLSVDKLVWMDFYPPGQSEVTATDFIAVLLILMVP